MPGKILLKKYSNRRLYDTEKSAYVTLSQVAETIRKGNIVEVVDAQTQEDVTAFTLTQIVMEEAKNRNALLPTPLLHLIIRYGENVLAEFFEKYLEQTIKSYLNYKNAVDGQFKKWLEMGQDFSDLAQKSLSDLNSLQSMLNPFATQAKKQDQKD